MHKKLGSFQGLKSYLFFLSFLVLISQITWASNNWYIIAPGDTFTPGSGPRSTLNAVTVVAGEAVDLTLYSVETTTNYSTQSAGSNNYTLDFAGSHTETFNPNNTTLDPAHGYTYRDNISASIIPTPTVSGLYTINASGGSLGGDSLQVPVQVVSSFTFTIPTFQAGTSNTITIQALDENAKLCSTYNGTANLSITDVGVNGATVNYGNITFTKGVCTAPMTFYHATTYARATVTKSSAPATASTSSTFTVNAGSSAGLLMIGPGQSLRQGSSSGNGRTSGSTQTSLQTAGANVNLDVYAVDAYWNTVSSTATVTLTPDNGQSAFSPQSLVGGHYQFSVTLTKVDDGLVGITASGLGTPNVDNVPMQATSFDSFGVSTLTGPYEAGANIPFSVSGYDQYGNTVTSSNIPSDVALVVIYGASVLNGPGSTLPWEASPALQKSNFTNGVYSGNLKIRRADSNYDLRLTYTAGSTETAYNFLVTPSTQTFAYKYMTILPGETWEPGNQVSGTWGYATGSSASSHEAGQPFAATIYATDVFGNLLTTNIETVTWSTVHTDAQASVSPTTITLSGGQRSVNFTMTKAYSNPKQQIRISGTYNSTESNDFVVTNTTFDHLSVSAGATQTAGNQFNLKIEARDQYENDVLGYSSDVYVTCPPLDYFSPTQSVIQIDGATSNYTPSSTTANWKVPGSAFGGDGVANMGTRIYRATTASATAYLFASEVATDTPSSHIGHPGQTVGMTVNPNTYTTLFIIVPGLSYRPGADSNGNTYFAGVGYDGTPLTQQKNFPFSVTVYATDVYWNIITGANDNFTTTTLPTSSDIHNQTYSLYNGLHQLDVTFNADTDYTIKAVRGVGVGTYETPYAITSFSVNHFDLELVNGGVWPANWVAGVPVNVSITAWSDATHVATTFNGTADLSCTLDHSPTMKVVAPTSITFVNGICNTPVAVFRANRTPTENNNITVSLGSTRNNSPTIRICHAEPEKMLIVEEGGMERFNGINPSVDATGEMSIQGQPSIQIAGTPITKIDFYLCDHFWNTVTTPAQDANAAITINCSDPFPAQILGVGSFSGGALTVNLDHGIYQANNTFVLYKVNGSTGQTIGVQLGGYTTYVLGSNKNAVPVKHADSEIDITSPYDSKTKRFNFIIDTSQEAFNGGDAVAGVPFAVTVAAVDCYGNTLNSINGGTAFGTYTSVNLSANTDIGNKSMWPTKLGTLDATKWAEGISYPWIYVYKKVTGSGEFLTAAYDFGAGGRTGVSLNFNVLNNALARLVAYTTGMSIPDDLGAGGTYIDPTGSLYPSTPPPATVSVFNNFGTPSAETAGTPATVLHAYTCDIYGNIVKGTPEFNVTLDTSDPYSPPPTNQPVDSINGYADFTNDFRFHTRGTQTITFSPTTVTATDGTTPDITVNPGAYYGLQILVPGLTAVEGSGNSGLATGGMPGIPPGGWYNGVSSQTTTTYGGSIQVVGISFPVTVQAVDLFGNFVASSPGDSIELDSDDDGSGSQPSTSIPLTGSLSGGRAWFNGKLNTPGPRKLVPFDKTLGADAIIDGGEGGGYTCAKVTVSDSGKFHYELIINGIREATEIIPVEAYPNTFNVVVEVRHDTIHDIVSLNKQVILEAFSDIAGLIPASGSLSASLISMSDGVATIPNETYDKAGTIYIRARDLDPNDPYPVASRFSPRIDVSASAPSHILMSSDPDNLVEGTTYQVEANHNVPIYAQVVDVNNNYVIDSPVTFDLSANGATSSTLSVTQTATNSTNGTAQTIFMARAENLQHTIVAHAGSATGTLTMNVTVTGEGGVYPNPFNPLLGQVAHIDYKLDEPADVKIEIYTLLGNLVWAKSIPSDQPGAKRGVNSVSWLGKNDTGVTIANGGYIVLVKVNGKERKRFKLGVYKGN
jgi:hypothetical protein